MASVPEMTSEEEAVWAKMKPYGSGYYSPHQLKEAPAKRTADPINPDYYRQEIETVDFMLANAKSREHFIEFARLTALGYIARAGKKPDNPIAQDAGKAIWWLKWLAGEDPRK